MKVRVLLVDDQEEVCLTARDAFSKDSRIEIVTCHGPREAAQIIKKSFFHLAFVDYHLDRVGDCGIGESVLRQLLETRPSAYRVLITTQEQQSARALLACVDPRCPIANAIWLRSGPDPLPEVIRECIKMINVTSGISIDGAESVYDDVCARINLHKEWIVDAVDRRLMAENIAFPSSHEVEYVIAGLFQWRLEENVENTFLLSHGKGSVRKAIQLERDFADASDDVVSIALTPMGRGKSSSAVYKGKPITRGGSAGLLTIVKIGPKSEILAEVSAFDRFVRQTRSTHRRVEVLSHCMADTVGAMCYSFAFHSPKEVAAVSSLQDYVEDHKWNDVIRLLRMELNPSQKEWYKKERFVGKPLLQFYAAAPYSLDAGDIVNRIPSFLNLLMDKHRFMVGGILRSGPRMTWSMADYTELAEVLLIPNSSDIANINTKCDVGYRSCIVHGDMNGENIIVSKENREFREILIDYRQTRRGPVFLDFAALEATIRLSKTHLSRCTTRSENELMTRLVLDERRIIAEAWSGHVPYERLITKSWSVKMPGWVRASREIVRLARANFGSGSRVDVKREYLTTCFLYALRLFKVRLLAEPWQVQARLRLLVWISAIVEKLREMDGMQVK